MMAPAIVVPIVQGFWSSHSAGQNAKQEQIFLLSAALAECISMGWSVTCDLLPIFVLLCVIFVIFAVTVSSIKQYSYKKMLRGYRSAMGATVSFSPFFFLLVHYRVKCQVFCFQDSAGKASRILNISTFSTKHIKKS